MIPTCKQFTQASSEKGATHSPVDTTTTRVDLHTLLSVPLSFVKQLSAVLLAIEGSCWQLPHPLSFYLPPTTYFFHHLLTAASPCALLMHTQRLLTCDCAHSVQQRYIVS